MIIRLKAEDDEGLEIAYIDIYEQVHNCDEINVVKSKISGSNLNKINELYKSVRKTIDGWRD